MKILKLLHNKRYDNWQECSHCGSKVIFIMPKFWEELLFNKLGTLRCTNCGDEQKV